MESKKSYLFEFAYLDKDGQIEIGRAVIRSGHNLESAEYYFNEFYKDYKIQRYHVFEFIDNPVLIKTIDSQNG